LVCMLLRPANFLILDEPTNHLDMQSQEVLQRARRDYPGSVMIVSHNRDFLDPLVTKTLEFHPERQPQVYAGNISYYLEKSEELAGRAAAAAKPQAKAAVIESGGNRKEQRRLEAAQREKRSKVLKPLELEFEAVEKKIAELEGAQATLTQQLSSQEVAADPEKFRQVSEAISRLAKSLENGYSRWDELSDEIDKVKKELGVED